MKEVITLLLDRDTQTAEGLRDNAEVGDADVGDAQLRVRHSCHTDEATDLDHVGEHGMLGAMELLHALDGEAVGADTSICAPMRTKSLESCWR